MQSLAPSDEQRRRDRALLERIKELDFAHRNRLPASGAGHVLGLRFLRTFLRRLLTPTRRARPEPVARPEPGAMAVTFVGHATTMLTTSRARVLTDPYLATFLYGLRRARAACLHATDRDDVSLVLISHAHADHLHVPSLKRLPRTAEVIVPPRTAGLVRGLGFADVIELGPGDAHRHHDLLITAVAARHDGARLGTGWLWRGACGYLVTSPDVTAYFAGDTGYFSGFAELGRRHRPDVALLPIAGYQPFAMRATHLSPLDAMAAFEDLRARILIPIAHGSFPLGYEPEDEPLAWLRELAAERHHERALSVLGHGETLLVRRPIEETSAPVPTDVFP